MAECLKDIVKTMAEGLKDIGKSIITQCLWPPIKSHIDYWWCFDNNIQVLRDGVRDLERETLDTYQKIENARLHTDKLRPGVEEWSKAGTEKLGEARRILEDDINPKAWNLISRYSIGKRAKKAAEDIKKHQNDGNFNVVADPAPPPAMGCTTNTSIMEFESRKRIEEEIIESLKESSVSMIGICGMGGVGKTAMAQRIRERAMEEKEKEKLFDEVVMVVVSQPIDMLKIQKEVAELLGLKFDVDSKPARADKLRKRLMDTNRKIVIFDDVWEKFKLEDLGVPSGFERCKILLTTRSKEVCKKMEFQKIIPIEILTEEEAWFLFKEKAGNCVEDSTLFPVPKHVVAKCNGLPLALVTVGKALRDQKEKSIWLDSLSQLSEANPADFPEVLLDVYNPLKLSYDYLDNERERLLFLLCCLFPEDYDIPVEELTFYFMGLRKFDGSPRIEEARNRMDRLVEKLKSRFLLIDGGKKHHVKMHDVVRDVAIFIGSKEKYGFLRSSNKISIENSPDISCNWMSVDISNETMNVDMGLRFPKLRLLMLMGLGSDIALEDIGDLNVSLEGITDLSVLSFSKMRIGSLPPTLRLLQNLRTLYLCRCKVGDISVIGELADLEILYCHYCSEIKELPAEIGRLNCLRLLELDHCYNLKRIPFGILSSLVQLEELKMFGNSNEWEAEENGKEKRSLRELESLPNLTCLNIHISDSKLAAQEIRLSQKLVKYRIVFGFDGYCGEASADYEKVMKLVLPRDIGAVGEGIQNLVKNTEYLRLEGDGSNNINLEQCQNLRYLEIWDCSTLKKVVKTKDCKSGINVFPILERLYLFGLENIEEIWDGTIILNQNNVSSLSNLKSVRISHCSKLRYLLSVSVATTCLLHLEDLWIEECSAMEQVFRNEMTDGCIEFPKLKELRLDNLPNLTAFCQGFESIKFPQLTEMWIEELPKLNSFCGLNSETGNDDTNTCHLLCNPKVEFGGLKDLTVKGLNYNNIRNIWCHQIPINFFNNLETLVISKINGIRSLMSYSMAKNLVSLKGLKISHCEEMVEVIEYNDDDKQVVDIHDCTVTETFTLGSLITPKLKELRLRDMPNLTSFCQGVENIKFPQLTYLQIGGLPKMNSFCPLNSETPHDDGRNHFHFLCNPKVEIDALTSLKVWRTVIINNNIRNIWCHQIPINFFNNLENLVIDQINGIRSLMPYSIAKNLVSLQSLNIRRCDDMVEVIEGIDDDKQVVDIKCLFPNLKTLYFGVLPKLRMFWQWNHTLELPLLEAVIIFHCRVMETFTLGSLKTPNFDRLKLNGSKIIVNIKDLNDVLNRQFNIENQNTSMIEDEDQDEDKDDNKEYNNENVNEDENENEDQDEDKDDNKEYNNENVNEDEIENEDANKDEDKDENNIKYNNENVNKEKDETERK